MMFPRSVLSLAWAAMCMWQLPVDGFVALQHMRAPPRAEAVLTATLPQVKEAIAGYNQQIQVRLLYALPP